MKKYPFLDLKYSNAPYTNEIKEAIGKVIDSGRYLHGEETSLFEKELAIHCGTKYCIGVSNGLDALRLIIRGYKELGKFSDGDEIIVPANTYIASVLAITDNGLIPHFVDADLKTLNLNTSLIEEAINARTRAIMTVHLYGTPCWDKTILQISQTYDLTIIEDNAQAINAKASYPGLSGEYTTGGLGHAAAFSFYPTKNIGALGDAGAVTTNDAGLANAVYALANYGSDYRYHNIYQGLNCRIDEIQAAVLRIKLRSVDKISARRRAIAKTYDTYIQNKLVTKPTIFQDMKQVWHQYPILVSSREEFIEYLKINGIDTDIHYATPPYKQACYKEYSNTMMPVTDTIANQEVSLPIGEPITTDDAITIAQIINGFDC